MTKLHIEIRGLDRLTNIFGHFKGDSQRYLNAAGSEAGEEVVNTQGLRKYPPATAANAPPTPYYIRGRGMQYKSHNSGSSERYGTQFYVRAEGMQTRVGNRSSYAQWLADDKLQARAMARIGWRKLIDVAKEKRSKIIGVFNGWIAKYLRDQGLT